MSENDHKPDDIEGTEFTADSTSEGEPESSANDEIVKLAPTWRPRRTSNSAPWPSWTTTASGPPGSCKSSSDLPSCR